MTTINKFSTDSGTVGDNITNDSTLTLTGTATANSTVNVYDGSALLGSATANASGAWSYTTGTLSNGSHSFTASTTSAGSPPSSSGFPDASTTGVPPGTSLTTVNGNFTSSYAGQIIDARDVNGTIIVNHPGVIIRNCEATYITVNADNVTIEDTTVTGANVGASGINLLGSDNTTVRRCDISGVENGIWLEANGCLIKDNYIHDLRNNASGDPHYDGLQIPGGSGVSNNLITHNNFDLGPGASSSITMSGATNIDITNNRLHGGTYNIYFEGGTTGCDVTNNVLLAGLYGDIAGTAEGSQTYSGNVKSETAASSSAAAATTDTSAALVVTIDAVAPTAATIATATANANSGLNLTGTAEANSVVKVYDGTTEIGTATANSSGAWGYTTGTLATGSHSLTARATDAAGNTGAASAVVTASTGTSPAPTPTEPTAPKINSFSNDSGTAGDGITNDNTLTLSGTAAANSTIHLSDGTTQLGTTTANSSGAWSYTTGTLSNGTHSFTAATTSSTSPSSEFPDASTTGVPPGTTLSTVNGNFTSSYAGQIIDARDVNGIIYVNHPGVIINNCEAQGITVNADNVTIQDSTITGLGLYRETAINLLGSDNTTIQRCDISNVENGIWLEANGCLIADNYLHDLIPYNSATDPHIDGIQIPGGAGVSNNLITHNNFDLGPGTSSSITMADATNIDITNNRISGGTFNIYFEGGNNPFGGGDTTGCDVTNNVFVDHVYGYVSGQSEALQTYTGNVTATGRPLVWSDTGHELVVSTSTTGTASLTASTSSTSVPMVVTVDTVAPTAPTIATPTNNTNGGLNLTGTAEANSVVTVYDGTTKLGTATTNSSGAWSYTTGTLATGSHSLTARAADAAGNTGAASAVVTASTGTSPTPTQPAAPSISSFSNDSGTAGDRITNDNTLKSLRHGGGQWHGEGVRRHDPGRDRDRQQQWRLELHDVCLDRWQSQPHGEGHRRVRQHQRSVLGACGEYRHHCADGTEDQLVLV